VDDGGPAEVREALEEHVPGPGLQIDVELGAQFLKPIQMSAWRYSDQHRTRVVITDLDGESREVLVGDIRGLWKDGRLVWPSEPPGTSWTPSGRWFPLVPQSMSSEDVAEIQRRADAYMRRRPPQ
jgi:hypothetical protein